MTPVQTEFPFTLPRGFVDGDGSVHQDGVMRLATAQDEVLPLKDPRVHANPAYAVVILLSRVVIKLGRLTHIDPGVIEGLFAEDLAYLQDLYNRINGLTSQRISLHCPHCDHIIDAEVPYLGGS